MRKLSFWWKKLCAAFANNAKFIPALTANKKLLYFPDKMLNAKKLINNASV